MGFYYWIVLSGHSTLVALLLQFLKFFLFPEAVVCFVSRVSHFALFLLLANYTFCFTKWMFLSDEVEPENKAVVITGCDSGFGNAIARRLDSKGFRVFAGLYLPNAPSAQALREACSNRLTTFPLDVTSEESVRRGLQHVIDHLGVAELYALVNNAGVFRGVSVELTPMDDFEACMQVNTFGTVRVTKAFLPLLRQFRGRVVNLTSLAGRTTVPHITGYTMSKFAQASFNDCLRHEMAPWGVRVVTVQPELFQTNMTDPSNVNRGLNSTLASVDPQVKSDYGEEYLGSLMSFVDSNLFLGSPRVDLVVDDLERAVSLEHPDPTYSPSRNAPVRVLFYLYWAVLPPVLRDSIVRIGLFLIRFPKLKAS